MLVTINAIANAIVPVLLSVIFGILAHSGPALIKLGTAFINSKLTEHQQAVLYAAVKVGERAAAAQGFTPEHAWESAKDVAVNAAINYAKRFDIDLDPKTLTPLIEAEAAKQERLRPILIDSSFVPVVTDGV
ncbi:hypothetical protein [Herpetosiphon giganteus]|uniref:hypothetical protein n=1 Tax=Herpetosiphon giganteus TaxID=2029754 RepID=UPI00195C8121|nr:hypothetical protein [Herpetosiphon giganteus]MBM7843753.1 hypothetical protein [Herpetosiphon giganteus]